MSVNLTTHSDRLWPSHTFKGTLHDFYGRFVVQGVSNAGTLARMPSPRKVFVLLFGLFRSSLPSGTFKDRLMTPLKQHGYDVKVVVHTFVDCNGTSGGLPSGIAFSPSAYIEHFQRLVPEATVITTPTCASVLDLGPAWEQCKHGGDAWRNHFTSYYRHLSQLYSLLKATEWMVERYPKQLSDTIIIHYRPDTLINCPLVLPQILDQVKNTSLFTPSGGIHPIRRQLNDRFAVGGSYSMIASGLRFLFTLEHCARTRVHAESFLWAMAQAISLEVEERPDLQVCSKRLNVYT